VIVSSGYLPTSAGSWSGAILSDTWDAICRPESYPRRAGEGREHHPATLTNRQRDYGHKKQIGKVSLFQREFLWPWLFAANILIASGLVVTP